MKKRYFSAALAAMTAVSMSAVAFAATDPGVSITCRGVASFKLKGSATKSSDIEKVVFNKDIDKNLVGYTWKDCEKITFKADDKFQIRTGGKVLEAVVEDSPAFRVVSEGAPSSKLKWYRMITIKGSDLIDNSFDIVLNPVATEEGTSVQFSVAVEISDPDFEKYKNPDGTGTSSDSSVSGGVTSDTAPSPSTGSSTSTAASETPAPAATLTNTETGIALEAAKDVIPEGAELKAEPTTANDTEDTATFDISIIKDGAAVQPNGKVTVKVPVPAKFNGISILYVYRVEGDKYISISCTVKDGNVVFDTDHFSTYVISSKKLAADDATGGSPATGIALAVAPVLLAGCFVAVCGRKRK